MKKFSTLQKFAVMVVVAIAATTVFTQKTVNTNKPVPPAKQDKIIFAVTESTRIEPIAFIEGGHLVNTVNGSDEEKILKTFSDLYYKPKTSYDLIFGGVSAGTVNVVSNNPTSDCGKNLADITVTSSKAKVKGFVMALATNAPPKATTGVGGVRRPPTAAEKTEIEKLVRDEYTRKKIPATVQKVLRYHNLTAVDIDNDGKVEIIGSYYVNSGTTERALLFFIAEKNAQGKFVFGHSEYQRVLQKDVMSQDIKDLDTGIYHELFLDVLDTDGDGKSEVFTMTTGFESNSFTVYRRNAGKWVKILETSNYHCAY